ncbi:MAG: hypothetical protein ABJF79_17405 [Paracoccaceae bacterium]
MLPAWRNAEDEDYWSGTISVARNQMRFLGELPGYTRILAPLCFHGNGVAMGSYAGHPLGQLDLVKRLRYRQLGLTTWRNSDWVDCDAP